MQSEKTIIKLKVEDKLTRALGSNEINEIYLNVGPSDFQSTKITAFSETSTTASFSNFTPMSDYLDSFRLGIGYTVTATGQTVEPVFQVPVAPAVVGEFGGTTPYLISTSNSGFIPHCNSLFTEEFKFSMNSSGNPVTETQDQRRYLFQAITNCIADVDTLKDYGQDDTAKYINKLPLGYSMPNGSIAVSNFGAQNNLIPAANNQIINQTHPDWYNLNKSVRVKLDDTSIGTNPVTWTVTVAPGAAAGTAVVALYDAVDIFGNHYPSETAPTSVAPRPAPFYCAGNYKLTQVTRYIVEEDFISNLITNRFTGEQRPYMVGGKTLSFSFKFAERLLNNGLFLKSIASNSSSFAETANCIVTKTPLHKSYLVMNTFNSILKESPKPISFVTWQADTWTENPTAVLTDTITTMQSLNTINFIPQYILFCADAQLYDANSTNNALLNPTPGPSALGLTYCPFVFGELIQFDLTIGNEKMFRNFSEPEDLIRYLREGTAEIMHKNKDIAERCLGKTYPTYISHAELDTQILDFFIIDMAKLDYGNMQFYPLAEMAGPINFNIKAQFKQSRIFKSNFPGSSYTKNNLTYNLTVIPINPYHVLQTSTALTVTPILTSQSIMNTKRLETEVPKSSPVAMFGGAWYHDVWNFGKKYAKYVPEIARSLVNASRAAETYMEDKKDLAHIRDTLNSVNKVASSLGIGSGLKKLR